jgi:hypothetical protein
MPLLILLTLILSLLSSSLAQYEGYCGSAVGYNLTDFMLRDVTFQINDRMNRANYYFIDICFDRTRMTANPIDRVKNSACASSSNYLGCATDTGDVRPSTGVLVNLGAPFVTWGYVNNSDYSQGVVWSPQDYISQIGYQLKPTIRLICNADAINPLTQVAPGGGWRENDYYLDIYVNVYTSLVCGPPMSSSVSSSTGSALPNGGISSSAVRDPSLDTSSTSVVVPNTTSTGLGPGCINPLLTWYFSYFALISSTYSIQFHGTFSTSSIIPVNIFVSQVVQIQATWTIIINGVSTSVPVTVLNPNAISGINLGGGSLYPLQGQSWSFYVGAELVTIGGNGIYPIIVNADVLTGGFIVSNNPIGQPPCQ